MIASIFAMDGCNVGDLNCAPQMYLGFPMPTHAINFWTFKAHHGPAIFGGGGMFVDPARLRHALQATRGIRIGWGLGHNTHGGTSVSWPDWIGLFDMIGVRDFDQGLPWVPCASCLHPSFDQPKSPEHEIVIYSHHRRPLANHGYPSLRNDVKTMSEAVSFLAKGECVVTNSYHGAYWAILLGRRVVVVEPWSSKFHSFRHRPELVRPDEWRAAIHRAKRYPEALDECRERNRWFHDAVCRRLP